MRNLLALLALLLIAFAVLGGWRGWYSMGGVSAETGKFSFRVEVHTDKMGADIANVFRSTGNNEGNGASSAEPNMVGD